MKQNKLLLLLLLTAFFTIWFMGRCIMDTSYNKEFFSSVSIRDHKTGISKASLIELAEQEKDSDTSYYSDSLLSLTAWKTEEGAELINPYLGRKAKVLAVTLWGNMRDIIPMALLSGNYVYQDDSYGCVLDSKTAYELFGTITAVNNELLYKNNTYIVRGVVKSSIPVFLLHSSKRAEAFPNLELKMSEKIKGKEEMNAVAFLAGSNLTDNYTLIDGYFYGNLLYSSFLLPLWLILLCLFIFALHQCFNYRNKQKKQLLAYTGLTLIPLSLILLLYYKAGNPLAFAWKFIPTRWSDFSYLTKVISTLKEQIEQLQYLAPNPRELMLLESLLTLKYRLALLLLLYFQLLLTGYFYKKKNTI